MHILWHSSRGEECHGSVSVASHAPCPLSQWNRRHKKGRAPQFHCRKLHVHLTKRGESEKEQLLAEEKSDVAQLRDRRWITANCHVKSNKKKLGKRTYDGFRHSDEWYYKLKAAKQKPYILVLSKGE